MKRAFALVLAAVMLSQVALADHVYSHRVVVKGRLVGSDGLPVPGQPVDLTARGDAFDRPCREAQRNVTDENGDFWFCYHIHAVAPGVTFNIRAGSVVESRNLDTDLRQVDFLLRDFLTPGVAPPDWNATFRIEGRVWDRGPVVLEGVPVAGTALVNVPVGLVLDADHAINGSAYDLRTDSYGDYAATLRIVPGQDPTALRVHVTTQGVTQEGRLDPVFHVSIVDFRLPLQAEHAASQPGAGASPPVSLALILAFVAVATLQVFWLRRKK